MNCPEKCLMFDINVAQLQENFTLRPHTAIHKIITHIEKGKKILDVGCAWGYLAKLLREKGCKVTGVEFDPVSAGKAKSYCEQVFVGDVESPGFLEKNLRESRFEAVIFSDILEHLTRPDQLVLKVRDFLVPGGRIYVSIPNVARFEHRFGLFFGRFDYSDAGALSKGHLRFFTRDSALKMLQEAGYRIEKIEYTGLASKIKLFPNLTAYQFLFVATL